MGLKEHFRQLRNYKREQEKEKRRRFKELEKAEKQRKKLAKELQKRGLTEEQYWQKQQQVEEWNKQKGPLVEAHKRLEQSGAIAIANELREMLPGAEIVTTPQTSQRIEFDPTEFAAVKTAVQRDQQKHEEKFQMEIGMWGVRREQNWKEFVISAPVNFKTLSVVIAARSTSYGPHVTDETRNERILFEKTFVPDEWQDRENFERSLAEALWRVGIRPT